MSIADRCMIANLSISVWTGHRLDKEASRKVTEDANAASDAARVNKHLIPKTVMAKIVTAQGALRTHFYVNTLPWKDNGDRLLTRKRFTTFIADHERLKADFDNAVGDFLDKDYAIARERAAFRMGELFKSDDYPSVANLRRRFQASLDIDAISTSGDFRVDLDAAEKARVEADMDAALRGRLGRATQDLWDRMASAVGHMAERLKDEDATFRVSMLEKMKDIVETMPDLNFLDDPAIEAMRARIERDLVGHDAATLRTDYEQRSKVAAMAADIYSEIGGLMKAFQDNQ